MMKTDRRTFLAGATALAASTIAGAASAQDVIQEILQSNRRGNWDDQFDARASAVSKKVSTHLPVFSNETVYHLEQGIAQYQQIVSQGGWPQVPGNKKLRLGVVDPDVEMLRRRLMVSGDLASTAGMSQSFDS